jgi:hypothetical protein
VRPRQLAERELEVLQRHRERPHEPRRVGARRLRDPVVVAAVELERELRLSPSRRGDREDRGDEVHVDAALVHRRDLVIWIEHQLVDLREATARRRDVRPRAEPRRGAVRAGDLERVGVEQVCMDVDDRRRTIGARHQSATPRPQPPSITISWPVMYSDAGEARNSASALMSSG